MFLLRIKNNSKGHLLRSRSRSGRLLQRSNFDEFCSLPAELGNLPGTYIDAVFDSRSIHNRTFRPISHTRRDRKPISPNRAGPCPGVGPVPKRKEIGRERTVLFFTFFFGPAKSVPRHRPRQVATLLALDDLEIFTAIFFPFFTKNG